MSRICALGHDIPDERPLCPTCGLGALPVATNPQAPEPNVVAIEPPMLAATPVLVVIPEPAAPRVHEEAVSIPPTETETGSPLLSPDGQHVYVDGVWIPWTTWESEQTKAIQAETPVQYSPDGKWWWDGSAWQPLPTEPPPMTTEDASSSTPPAIDRETAVPIPTQSEDSPTHGSGQRSLRLPAFMERLPPKALIGLAVILVAGLAAVVVKGASGGSHAMHGTYSAFGVPLNGAANGPGVPCRANGVSSGDPVIVTDHSRKQIAVGSLSGEGVEGNDINYCIFTFTMTVPDTDIYNVQVGDNSNSVAFTRAELASNGWRPGITNSG